MEEEAVVNDVEIPSICTYIVISSYDDYQSFGPIVHAMKDR